MRANELRLGNYVLNDSDEVRIDKSLLAYILSTNSEFDFHPIPLTEEHLIKLGFELKTWDYLGYYSEDKRKITGYVKDKIWCFMPEGDNKLFAFGRRIGDDKTGWRFSEREGLHSMGKQITEYSWESVIYLHTLQGLYFSLTKTELILK